MIGSYHQLNDALLHPLLSAVTGPLWILMLISLAWLMARQFRMNKAQFTCLSVVVYLTAGQLAMLISMAGLADRLLLMIIAFLPALTGTLGLASFIKHVYKRVPYPNITQLYRGEQLDKLLLILITVGFFLIALSPATDVDSLDYHLGVPLDILSNGAWLVRPDWIHSRLIGTGDFVNLLGLSIGADNVGAVVNFFSWLGILYILPGKAWTDRKSLIIKLLACVPLFIFFVSSQKPQLIGIVAILAATLAVLEHPGHRRIDLSVFVVIAVCGVKPSLYLIALPVLLMILLQAAQHGHLRRVIFSGLLAYVFYLFPIHVYNFHHYGDPISPLLYPWLGPENQPYLQSFRNHLKYFGKGYPFPIRLVLPSSFGLITEILGIGWLAILLLRLKLGKSAWMLFLAVSSAILVTLLSQRVGRFYIAPYAFLVFAIALQPELPSYQKWFSRFIRLQLIGVFLAACIGVCSLSYGIFSWGTRQHVMHHRAQHAAAMHALDQRLPQDAVIIMTMRTHALAPRRFIANDHAFLLDHRPDIFKSIIRKYAHHPIYLITTKPIEHDHPLYESIRLNDVIDDLPMATRKPLPSKKQFRLHVYIFKNEAEMQQ